MLKNLISMFLILHFEIFVIKNFYVTAVSISLRKWMHCSLFMSIK